MSAIYKVTYLDNTSEHKPEFFQVQLGGSIKSIERVELPEVDFTHDTTLELNGYHMDFITLVKFAWELAQWNTTKIECIKFMRFCQLWGDNSLANCKHIMDVMSMFPEFDSFVTYMMANR